MGLFDQVVGAVTGASSNSGEAGGPLLASIMQLINNPQTGGLSGLIESFQRGGLGEIVNSWVSTGQNLPVSADQIHAALGSEQVGNIANAMGISPQQASGQLADLLPQIIDKLTPNGNVPEGGELMAQGLELLKGRLFS